ncbi:MAG: luciferase family protein [Dehalococcoidia bacterium]
MDRFARQLRRGLLAIDGVLLGGDVFSGGDAFWVNGTEIAYLDGDTALAVRLTRRVISEHRKQIRADARITRRAPSSDWVSMSFASAADMRAALEWTELAAAAHRPPSGVPAKAPPEGAALARRRRFH